MPESSRSQERRRKPREDALASISDRLPPYSEEAEQGVLGCILLDPPRCLPECRARLSAGGAAFFDLRHTLVYDTMVDMAREHEAVDVITLQQRLKDRKQLDSVGGVAYLSSLADVVPSAANLKYYLDILQQKHALRQIIQVATEVVSDSFSVNGDFDGFMFAAQSRLVGAFQQASTGQVESGEVWSIDDLLDYDVENDPNAVIGFQDGKTTRYLCKGYGSWLIGPSGLGKSSLIAQQAICFALGRDFCGITPVRPLRVLVVQAENDKGDVSEQVQGIVKSLGYDEFGDEVGELRKRMKIVTERRMIGTKFCAWLQRQIAVHRADVVFCDPFLSFAGIDIARQDQCSQFLRTVLNPILVDTGAVLIAAHHTGKPKESKATAGWTAFDHAYAGIGSSELVNWARAVSVFYPVGSTGKFQLMLAKRGNRAGAHHPNGEWTDTIYLQRDVFPKISWTQVDPPEEPADATESKGAPGRPSAVDEVLSLSLGPLIDAITEPISRNELAKRIEEFAAKKHKDVSNQTCRRVIKRLVENGAIRKRNDGFVSAQKEGKS